MENEFVIKDYTFRKSHKFHQHYAITDDLILETLTRQYDYIKDSLEHNVFNITVTHDFSHVIGVTHCVECPPHHDGVYFKRRGKRPYLTRMVKGIQPKESSKCTIVVRFDSTTGGFVIITAWIGNPSKPELGNINYFETCNDPLKEVMESAEFWLNHAMIDEETEKES